MIRYLSQQQMHAFSGTMKIFKIGAIVREKNELIRKRKQS